MKPDLLDRQKDLIEVLIATVGDQVKSGLKDRDPQADLEKLSEEWGMTRPQLIDTLVYVRLNLHNVIVQAEQKQDSPDLVMAPLKMLAGWLDEIPEVGERAGKIINSSGSGGKGFVKIDLPPIIKECLQMTPQQPQQRVTADTPFKPPELV